MAFLNETFNAADLPQSDRNYDALPPGWYTATIAAAELTPTKAGNGAYIKVRYDITGPTHQGRVVFANLNIRNANPEAERIGRQQLGELMRAIGLATVQDTDQLVGAPVQIKLKVREARDGYEASNDVAGFKAVGNAPSIPSAPAAKPAAAPAPAASTGARPPWAK